MSDVERLWVRYVVVGEGCWVKVEGGGRLLVTGCGMLVGELLTNYRVWGAGEGGRDVQLPGDLSTGR